MNTDDRLDALADSARGLTRSVDRLARGQRSNRIIILVIILLLLGLGVALAEDYTTKQQQAQTRIHVLCPLYTLLLAVTPDPAHLAALPADQRAQTVAAVQVIRDGYTTLGCTPPLSG